MSAPPVKTRRPVTYALIVLSVFILLAVSFLAKRQKESVSYSRILMGTVVELTFTDGDETRYDSAAEAAFAEISRLEDIFSSYKPASDVSMVSKNSGRMVHVHPEVVDVVETALRVARLSDGAFDPTVGALASLWGYSGESGVVPAKEEVEKLLALVDYEKVTVDRLNSEVGLAEEGMVLNLGGVAKGFIVDRAIEKLKEGKVTRGIVHAGGDMTVFQTISPARPFTIGIRHPRKEDAILAKAFVTNGAVTTSGDYERFFMKDGVRYHHILDPKTGFPARLSRSVTVIATDPTLADALSTAVFVMGPEKGMELVDELAGVEAVVVDAKGKVITSKGFWGEISPPSAPEAEKN